MTRLASANTGRRELTRYYADAYAAAVERDANMYKVTRAIETIRAAFAERRTGLRGLVALDDEIGLAESRRLREVLVHLRESVFVAVRDDVLEGFADRFAEDDTAASEEWLQMYAAALNHWRLELCGALVDVPFRLRGIPPLAEFATWTQAFLQDRWGESEPLFLVLGEHETLDSLSRANFVAVAAEIRLYSGGDEDGCLALLERAEQIDADAPLVPLVRGEYWLNKDYPDLERSAEAFRRAQEIDPRSDAWYMIGDIHLREGRPEAAESAYRDALARLPGESAPYTRLLSLYDDTRRVSDQEPQLHALVERGAAADRLYAHRVYVAMGDVYERCGRYDDAYEWYERAVNANSLVPGPHEARGYALVEEGRVEEAERAFRRSIELAPEAFDGHWGLGWAYERASRFSDAIAVYEQCLALRPSWSTRIRVRLAAMERALGNLDKAENALLALLRDVPDDDTVVSELHELVDEYCDARDDCESARRLLRTIREVIGPSYEHELENRLGVISYRFDDHERAAEEFRRAIAADPTVAIAHRNLSDALKEFGEFEGAREALQRGFELDEDLDSYHASLGLIENDEANALYEAGQFELARDHYERAAELRPNDAVIHSNVALAWVGIWEPGERLHALDRAEQSLRRALSLDAASDDYRQELEAIEAERRLHERYGLMSPSGAFGRVVGVTLAADLVERVLVPGTTELSATTMAVIAQMRERVRDKTGMPAPPIRFAEEEAFARGSYSLDVVERMVASGNARSDARLFAGSETRLQALGIACESGVDPTGAPAWWVAEAEWSQAEAAGVELWEIVEYPLRHVEDVLVSAFTTARVRDPDLPACGRRPLFTNGELRSGAPFEEASEG